MSTRQVVFLETNNNYVITSESLHLRDVCLCGDQLSPPSELLALIPDPLSTPIHIMLKRSGSLGTRLYIIYPRSQALGNKASALHYFVRRTPYCTIEAIPAFKFSYLHGSVCDNEADSSYSTQ